MGMGGWLRGAEGFEHRRLVAAPLIGLEFRAGGVYTLVPFLPLKWAYFNFDFGLDFKAECLRFAPR